MSSIYQKAFGFSVSSVWLHFVLRYLYFTFFTDKSFHKPNSNSEKRMEPFFQQNWHDDFLCNLNAVNLNELKVSRRWQSNFRVNLSILTVKKKNVKEVRMFVWTSFTSWRRILYCSVNDTNVTDVTPDFGPKLPRSVRPRLTCSLLNHLLDDYDSNNRPGHGGDSLHYTLAVLTFGSFN